MLTNLRPPPPPELATPGLPMTTKPQAPEASTATPNDSTEAGTEQASKPAADFRFLLTPETFAPKQNGDQPWHQRNNKSNHDKRPHTPPRGTRRSMGKR